MVDVIDQAADGSLLLPRKGQVLAHETHFPEPIGEGKGKCGLSDAVRSLEDDQTPFVGPLRTCRDSEKASFGEAVDADDSVIPALIAGKVSTLLIIDCSTT